MRWPSRCAFWRSTRTTSDGAADLHRMCNAPFRRALKAEGAAIHRHATARSRTSRSAFRRRRSVTAKPALRQRLACSTKRHRRCLASGGTRQGRFVRRRGTQHRGRRAYSHASSSDLPRLFERSAQRVASYAARPRGEYRSAVGPKGRPPHHEPLPGAARRAARTFEGDSGLSWIAAMRRDPALDVGASNAGSYQNENG